MTKVGETPFNEEEVGAAMIFITSVAAAETSSASVSLQDRKKKQYSGVPVGESRRARAAAAANGNDHVGSPRRSISRDSDRVSAKGGAMGSAQTAMLRAYSLSASQAAAIATGPSITLRDLLVFLQKRRTVTTEYSVGLINRMYNDSTDKPAMSVGDVVQACSSEVFGADWRAVVCLALTGKQQLEQSMMSRGLPSALKSDSGLLPSPPSIGGGGSPRRPQTQQNGSSFSPRGTQIRRQNPYHIPPSPRSARGTSRLGSSSSLKHPNTSRSTGGGALQNVPTSPMKSSASGSAAISNAKTKGRFLPVINHPKWSAHAEGHVEDCFEHQLVDEFGRTLHEVKSMKEEIKRIEAAKATPNDHGIIYCGNGAAISGGGGGPISAVLVDVGHNTSPKFLRSCHVEKGPTNLTIEEIVNGGSMSPGGSTSPTGSPRRPLTTKEKEAIRHQKKRMEDEAYQSVLTKLVNYLQ